MRTKQTYGGVPGPGPVVRQGDVGDGFSTSVGTATPAGESPNDHYLHTLPPSARNLLNAARRLLIDGGFDALRLEAIARESGENKASIRYYFGDKAGLIAALVDDLLHDATVNLVRQTEGYPRGSERFHSHVRGSRELMEEPEYVTFFDVLPHAIRDQKLRWRIAQLYEWYRQMNVRSLGSGEDTDDQAKLEAIATVFVAAVDGLAIQVALDPEGFDPGPGFDMLETMMKAVLGGCEPAV